MSLCSVQRVTNYSSHLSLYSLLLVDSELPRCTLTRNANYLLWALRVHCIGLRFANYKFIHSFTCVAALNHNVQFQVHASSSCIGYNLHDACTLLTLLENVNFYSFAGDSQIYSDCCLPMQWQLKGCRNDLIGLYYESGCVQTAEQYVCSAYSDTAASGVTMGWLLRFVTGGPSGKGAPDSSRVLNDKFLMFVFVFIE